MNEKVTIIATAAAMTVILGSIAFVNNTGINKRLSAIEYNQKVREHEIEQKLGDMERAKTEFIGELSKRFTADLGTYVKEAAANYDNTLKKITEQAKTEFSVIPSNAETALKKNLESVQIRLNQLLDDSRKSAAENQSKLANEFESVQSQLKRQIADSQKTVAENQSKLANEFESVQSQLKRQIAESRKATAENQAELKKKMDEICNNAQIKIKESLDKIEALSKSYVTNEQRANEYWTAAKENVEKEPEVAKILYSSALSYSTHKVPILSDLAEWNKKLIQEAIKNKNDLGFVQASFAEFLTICETNIAMGSVADMEKISEIKDKLLSIKGEIENYEKATKAAQEKLLKGFRQRVANLKSYDDAEKLITEIEGFDCLESLTLQKDSIIADVIQKQTCLTTSAHPLMLPAVNEKTPWNSWLGNFIRRLKSDDIPVARKMEDIGTAADILQVAKEKNIKDIAEKMNEFESLARSIYLKDWQERADQIISSDKRDINNISSLLIEAGSFPDAEEKDNRERLIKLNKISVKVMLEELEKTLRYQKDIENHIPEETFLQVSGITQNQYLQVLFNLLALHDKYSDEFTTEINDVLEKIGHMEKLVSSYKTKVNANELQKLRTQHERFVTWANEQLATAKKHYNAAEEIAGTWGKTTKSPEAVTHYVEAWQALMSIHPGDLQSVDPALYQTVIEYKGKIENRWTPTEYQRQRVRYKHIADF